MHDVEVPCSTQVTSLFAGYYFKVSSEVEQQQYRKQMLNNIRSKLTHSEVSIMELCIFCSDDRRARSVMSNQSIDCVSVLASFYLIKNYLYMSKEYAQVFFDSWMALHRDQKCSRIYSENGYQLERVPDQDIFDMLYENKLDLQKDGSFKRKQHNVIPFWLFSQDGALYLSYKEKNMIYRFDLYCIISLDVGS